MFSSVREISYDTAVFSGRGFDARYSTNTGSEIRLRCELDGVDLEALARVEEVDRYAKVWGLVQFGRLFTPLLPVRLRVEALSLEPAEEDRFRGWCLGILAESFYLNGMPAELDLTFSGEPLAPRGHAPSLGERAILMSGGGKDSVVSAALLRTLGVPYRWFGVLDEEDTPTRHIARVAGDAPMTASAWHIEIKGASGFERFNPARLGRFYRWRKKRVRRQCWRSLMSPVVEACLLAEATGSRYVLTGNERSASEGNGIHIGDLEVNHQYTKCYTLEREFAAFVAKYLHPELTHASLLRPFSELQIGRIFASQPEYWSVFRSCNRRTPARPWCQECPKCAFVFLLLSAVADEECVSRVFDADLLADPGLVQTYRDLCGRGGHKPLECVGEPDECLLALHLASKRRTAATLHPELAAILPGDAQAEALQGRVLGTYNEDNGLPPRWNDQLRRFASL